MSLLYVKQFLLDLLLPHSVVNQCAKILHILTEDDFNKKSEDSGFTSFAIFFVNLFIILL